MLRRLRCFPRQAMVLSLLTLAVLVSSCGKKENEANEAGEEGTTPPAATSPQAAPAPDTALTDAAIEGIVSAANTIDIQNGEMAQSTSKNDAVKAFAAQMIADHTSINSKANDLAGKIGVMAKTNDTARELTSAADAKRNGLKAVSGAAFDKAYIENEVAYHQSVIDLLDNTLIPRAQNSELRSLLQGVGPLLAQHLTHAKKVQASLSR